MKHSRFIILFLVLIGMATMAFAQTNCLTFDGSNDYVYYGDILDMGQSDWSYQIWFKTSALTGGLMGKSITAGNPGRWSMHFSTASAGLLRVIFHGSAGINLDANEKPGGGAWNDGTWHNATVTCDRSGLMTLYMDGAYNNSISIAAQSAANLQSTGHFYIGAYGDALGTSPNPALYFNGSLDEARVWSKCLTAAEVAANWDTQIDYPQDNLVGYWRMNEESGIIVHDISGENHDGELRPLVDGPTWNENGPTTLPVELSSFTAVLSAHHKVVLTWVTQSETSVMGFYIYRGTEPNLAQAQQISALIDASNSSDQQTYVYTDTEINQIGTYYYWLMVADIDGSESFHGPISVTYESPQPDNPGIPLFTELKQIYPNPFNPSTNISYVLAEAGDVLITIYNPRGQELRRFQRKNVAAGTWNLVWDGKDQNGSGLSSGVYYIRMQVGAESSFKKAVLMK